MKLYANIQRFIYTFCYYTALPVLLLRLLWKSRKNPAYRSRWQERLGYLSPSLQTNQPTIWVHAVSVGETLAAVPLIKSLLQHYPHYRVVVTSTTPTGSALVKKNFSDQVVNIYLSFDLPNCIHRFLKCLKPKLGIIMETELWPNLLYACHHAKIPLLLANARLSEKSMKGYQKIASLTAAMLHCFAKVATQSIIDGERFIALGLQKECLLMTGNIKFDMELSANTLTQGKKLRHSWGAERPILIAASTHAGEEEKVLMAFNNLRNHLPNLMLILVPRHPERFEAVAQLCSQHHSLARRSTNDTVNSKTAILLGDTMGELLLFYAAADIAFVGGSFVPVGGHNLIEPAILQLPVLTGPYLHNFNDISQLLIAANAAKIVNNPQELMESSLNLFQDASARQQMGLCGYNTILKNRGALDKHIEYIGSLLKQEKKDQN